MKWLNNNQSNYYQKIPKKYNIIWKKKIHIICLKSVSTSNWKQDANNRNKRTNLYEAQKQQSLGIFWTKQQWRLSFLTYSLACVVRGFCWGVSKRTAKPQGEWSLAWSVRTASYAGYIFMLYITIVVTGFLCVCTTRYDKQERSDWRCFAPTWTTWGASRNR